MESLTIKQCMNADFVSFTTEMPVVQASAKLVKHGSRGGPVLDQSGKLIGWISEQDLLSAAIQVYYYQDRVATVADVMKTQITVTSLDASILSLAKQMLEPYQPKTYPVVTDDNKVIGVVTRGTILKAIDSVLE
jgi:CBS domain-containing protein